MNRLVSYIPEKYKNWKLLLVVIAALLLVVGLIIDSQPRPSIEISRVPKIALDQIAPKNHSLYPVRPLNHQALSNVMGVTGMVALYDFETSRLVIDGLKIIRSQGDPETFLALVPDALVPELIKVDQKIMAVLKNPNENYGTKFVRENTRKQRPIYYGTDQL